MRSPSSLLRKLSSRRGWSWVLGPPSLLLLPRYLPTLLQLVSLPRAHFELRSSMTVVLGPHEPLNYSVFVFAFASLYLGLSQDVE
jgi:hypothetical protein